MLNFLKTINGEFSEGSGTKDQSSQTQKHGKNKLDSNSPLEIKKNPQGSLSAEATHGSLEDLGRGRYRFALLRWGSRELREIWFLPTDSLKLSLLWRLPVSFVNQPSSAGDRRWTMQVWLTVDVWGIWLKGCGFRFRMIFCDVTSAVAWAQWSAVRKTMQRNFWGVGHLFSSNVVPLDIRLPTFLRDDFLVKFLGLLLKDTTKLLRNIYLGVRCFTWLPQSCLETRSWVFQDPSQGGQFGSGITLGCIVVACWRSRRLHLLSSQFSMHACCGWRQRKGLYETWNDF